MLRRPQRIPGYAHGADDLQLGDERHGRLLTGDLAYCDEDGFYYIAGRKKRFVKIMGKRVNMDEVEQLFKNAFADRDFACTGGDDDLLVFTTLRKRTAPTWRISSSPRRAFIQLLYHPLCRRDSQKLVGQDAVYGLARPKGLRICQWTHV